MTYVLPARYYVALLQTVFLAGDVWEVIVPNAAVLAAMAIVLSLLTRWRNAQDSWTEDADAGQPSCAFSR